jgi:hypothetical protein
MTHVNFNKFKPPRKLFSLFALSLLIVLAPFFWLAIFYKLTITFSPKDYSPDRSYYAQASESNGGATTGFVTSISIIDASTPFSFSQIISFRKGTAKSIISTNGPLDSLHASWDNENELHVSINNCDEEYYRVETWKNIQIIYDGSCQSFNH